MLMSCEAALQSRKGKPNESIFRDLKDFDMYHCLLAGTMSTARKIVHKYGSFPAEYIDWLQVCSGGLLFDTDMLAMEERDPEVDIHLETYDQYNRPDSEYFPSGEYFAFAKDVTGDLFCFKKTGERTFDAAVYQWNHEEQAFTLDWPSFYGWMRDQIDDAILAISDKELDPIPLKMEE